MAVKDMIYRSYNFLLNRMLETMDKKKITELVNELLDRYFSASDECETLKTENTALVKKNTELEEKIAALEARLASFEMPTVTTNESQVAP
jgi:regulator of replication initiation timing